MTEKYWAVGIAAILLTSFGLMRPMETAAYDSLSTDDIIATIEEQAGDLSPETEALIREYLDNLKNLRSNNGETTGSGVIIEGIPAFNGCFSDFTNPELLGRSIEPDDPVSMNTIKNGNIIKTIHAEKEIFSCVTEQGAIPVIVEVTTYGEIYEDISTKSIIDKKALAITCVKEGEFEVGEVSMSAVGQVLGCKSEPIPAGPIVVRNCDDSPLIFRIEVIFIGVILETFFPLGPDHPQEMNTINKGSIVKTVEAQKEIFACNLDPSNDIVTDIFGIVFFTTPLYEKKVDIVTFTDIWEDLGLLPDPIVKKEFLSFRCVTALIIDEDGDGTVLDPSLPLLDLEDFVASVESCQFSSIQD